MSNPIALHSLSSGDTALPGSPVASVVPIVTPSKQQDVESLKVLHVVNGEHFSGAERVQSHLARCLPNYGVNIDFACLTPDRFPEQFDVENVKLHDIAMKSRYDVGAGKRVATIATQEKFDLLHAHTPRSAMVASIAARIAGLPWIYHVHSPAASDSTRQIQNRINLWVERQSLRSVNHQIVVSNSLHSRTTAYGYPEDTVTVVHNGVPAVRPERTVFPSVGGTWTLGIVALHRPRKGLEVLLESLKITRDRGFDVRVRCIGPFETDEYRTEINQQVAALGLEEHVEFVGFVSDIPAALAELDAMVLPSLFGEGLPMVVLEAMAAAVPVIATRVEGTPEAVRHHREGLLAEAGDSESLAEEIVSLVSGAVDWHSLADAAAKRHSAEFSDMSMARGTADVYRRVLAATK